MKNESFERKFTYLRGNVKNKKLFAFDIETYNNNKNFLCCFIYGENYAKTFLSKQEVIKEISENQIFRNSFICATNLMFDFFALFSLDFAVKHFNIIERNGILTFAKTYISYDKKHKLINSFMKDEIKQKENYDSDDFYKIEFIDSLAHLKSSVENIGKIINIPKMEKPKFLGSFPQNTKEWDYIIKYNMNDSKVTYEFMKFCQNNYNNLGCNLKPTISSTSMDLFRRKFMNSHWIQDKREVIDFNYYAYFGGRCEVFKRGLFDHNNFGKIFDYDVNSLYPYVMKVNRYPLPEGYLKKKVTHDDIDSFEGVCLCTLKSYDSYIPYLPFKSDKLMFPVGKFTGYYDFYSLRSAVNNGYEIESIKDGVIYENTFSPFKNFVDTLYKLKNEFKAKNDGSDLIPKICLNSLYGRFGYNYQDKEQIKHESQLDIPKDLYNNIVMKIPKTEYYRVITSEISKIPKYVFNILSVYVTAYARGHMFTNYKKIGLNNVFYTDTDSIFTNKRIYTDNELGSFKLEKSFDEIIFVKPKFYGGIHEDNYMIKIKGMFGCIKDYNDFKSKINNNNVCGNMKSFTKFKTGLRGKHYVNQVVDIFKEMDLEDNKRIWQKKFNLNYQDSKPIKI